MIAVCSSRLISINHHIISLILPTYTGRYCLWVEVEVELDRDVIRYEIIQYHLSISSLPLCLSLCSTMCVLDILIKLDTNYCMFNIAIQRNTKTPGRFELVCLAVIVLYI